MKEPRLTKQQREELRAYRERRAYEKMKSENDGCIVMAISLVAAIVFVLWIYFSF